MSRSLKRLSPIKSRQRIRYVTMGVGILALAPPLGFVAQLFGGATLCGPLCPRMAIGPDFFREVVSRPAGSGLLLVWLSVTLFSGRWFCSHLCPAGGLTEFGSKLLPARLRVDYCRIVDVPFFRYGFLTAYLLLPVLGLSSICCSYCNLSAVPESFGALFSSDSRVLLGVGIRSTSALLFVVLLGTLARDGRGHCHLLCPLGAVDSLVNAAAARLPFAWRVRVRQDGCSGCGRCVRVCPTWAISLDEGVGRPAGIDHFRCNGCRLCQDSCPTGAIAISRPSSLNRLGVPRPKKRIPADPRTGGDVAGQPG